MGGTLVISRSCVADIANAPNINELLEEYGQEAAISGLPQPIARFDLYERLEASGAMYVAAAHLADKLVGVIAVLLPILPHYGAMIAVTESFFVMKAARKSGAGIRLLRLAEKHVKECGSPGLLVSAPIGGILADVLPRVGYRETNRVFFRKL